MNPKDGFDFNEILWSFLDQSRRWDKNYKRDHPLPLSWRPFTVVFLQRNGYKELFIWTISLYELGYALNEKPMFINCCLSSIVGRDLHSRRII